MTAIVPDGEPVIAETQEHAVLDRLDEVLAVSAGSINLVGPSGEVVEIPPSLHGLMRGIVGHLARSEAVAIVQMDRELSTQQAADLLNVSRPYLIQLLDRGEMPYARTGSHRRIRMNDVMAYKQRRDIERRAALRRLTQMSQQLGLYDKRRDS